MSIRRAKKQFKYCDCGRTAKYKLRILLYRPDLETEVHASLYLCTSCYQLEQDLQRVVGKKPPKAIRLA